MTAAEVFSSIRGECPRGSMMTDTTWTGSAFVYGLVCLFQPQRVAELGCRIGCTSVQIAKALSEIGEGAFVGYEIDALAAVTACDRLDIVWPGGAWKIHMGDFFETCESEPVDFAFIDIDPKRNYVPAYERLSLTEKCVVVAHDLTLAPEDVSPLAERLSADGFTVHLYQPERGFVVAVRT